MKSTRETNAVLSRCPLHPDVSLCCLTHGKLQDFTRHRGHLYLNADTWHTSQRLLKQTQPTSLIPASYSKILCTGSNKRVTFDRQSKVTCKPSIESFEVIQEGAMSNRIWNNTTLRSPKQQIWLRTALCGGWCQHMALHNLTVACQKLRQRRRGKGNGLCQCGYAATSGCCSYSLWCLECDAVVPYKCDWGSPALVTTA